MRPVVGIISNRYLVNDDYPVQASGMMYVDAIAQVADCIPVIVTADSAQMSVEEAVATCDGFLLTGGRANVHPEEYGEAETEAHGSFDRQRDRLVLPLIRFCVELGLPILGICRGLQEVAVAMDSTLYPEIRDLPGRSNHRMPPDGTLAEKFAPRHAISFTEGGVFHRLMNAQSVMTNTLHGQGIKTAGARVVVDGCAPDGTPEAIYVKDAPGFTLSVQWHPEWEAAQDPVSRALFRSFGDAARDWSIGRGKQALKSG